MESLNSVIFSTFVFNNIMELTFIFPPALFRYPDTKNKLTPVISMI
jgi:hypothetical protein